LFSMGSYGAAGARLTSISWCTEVYQCPCKIKI
jgi:hypothetical protein